MAAEPSSATPTGTENGEAALAELGYQQELKRSLRLRDLLVYGMIFMVPIATFAIFGVVFNTSKGMVPLTYLIGLVAMLFTALSCWSRWSASCWASSSSARSNSCPRWSTSARCSRSCCCTSRSPCTT